MKISENQFPINSPFISSIYNPLGGLAHACECKTVRAYYIVNIHGAALPI